MRRLIAGSADVPSA